MRKGILKSQALLFLILIISLNGYSVSIIMPAEHVSPSNSEYLRASVFVKLSAKEFGVITGRKLNLPQRIYFKVIQRRLKRELRNNPDLLITDYYDPAKEKFKFDVLWFVIASMIGPLGIIAAYTSPLRKGGPTKINKLRSAWLGFGLFLIWFGALFLF